MNYKISEPNPNSFFRFIAGAGIAVIALWFLTACAPASVPTEVARGEGTETMSPADTPVVIVVTATPQIVTIEPTDAAPVCPPELLGQVTVGHLPELDLGEKKSPVSVSFGCMLVTVSGEGWSLRGLLSEDGTKLTTCALFADRQTLYPCTLELRNLDHLNVRAFYQN